MKLLLEHNPRHNTTLEDLTNEAIYVINNLIVLGLIAEAVREWALNIAAEHEKQKAHT